MGKGKYGSENVLLNYKGNRKGYITMKMIGCLTIKLLLCSHFRFRIRFDGDGHRVRTTHFSLIRTESNEK